MVPEQLGRLRDLALLAKRLGFLQDLARFLLVELDLDLLVVEAKMPVDDLRAVLARIPAGLVLAPSRAKLLTAGPQVREVPRGSRARIGPFLVTFQPRGGVEVIDSRRPP